MKKLNSICLNCVNLYKNCKGTQNQVWTGCVYRKVKAEQFKDFHSEKK